METNHIFELYRREVYRIGWRLQYRNRKLRRNECPLYDNVSVKQDTTNTIDNKIIINDLLEELPDKGRIIIHKLYLDDLTEAEVASQLQISQQAVNKWKRKMVHQLSQIVNL